MKKLFFLFLISTVVSQSTYANLEYNQDAKNIYNLVFALKFDDAKLALKKFKVNHPKNGVYIHLENYIDIISIFLSEEESLYNKLKDNKSSRLANIKEYDKKSPYYLYIKADIELQWALVNLKFGEYFSSFLSIKKAYSLLNKNKISFPNFLPNQKSLGVLHAIVGAIPDKYKWGVKILSGMDGTILQGQSELLSVINEAKNTEFPFLKETYTLYSFIGLHLKNDSELAWNIINEANLNPKESSMDCFILSNIAMRSGRFKIAKKILEEKPKGSTYFPFYYLDYLEGLVDLYQLNPEADIHFLRFLANFKGINYIKEAYQKLAWHSLIIGDIDGYFEYLTICKDSGYTKTGGDKNAQKEALRATKPQVDLLTARLLFDGANYILAKEIMNKADKSKFDESEHLEYIYRYGRIEDKLNHYDEAIFYYNQTINIGFNEPDYFACNAALQLGKVYEKLNNCNQAKLAYNKCLQIEPYDYARSIHALAKAGINRIGDCN